MNYEDLRREVKIAAGETEFDYLEEAHALAIVDMAEVKEQNMNLEQVIEIAKDIANDDEINDLIDMRINEAFEKISELEKNQSEI